MTTSFHEHLAKQLGFIRRSCTAYDAGYTDESIRIATAIRVLMHNTKKSTSLLKFLGATTIKLLSTAEEPSVGTVFYMGLGVTTSIRAPSSVSATYEPLLNGPINYFVLPNAWWEQIVYVLNPSTRLTRQDIVLAAANKDGGAHIDPKLTPAYEALAKEGAAGALVYQRDGDVIVHSFTNAHLVAIRQMGHELLHSPDLLSLSHTA
jgi:hypothetical protein